MLNITDVLEEAPNVLVTGCPASQAVDLVMTEYPVVPESVAPHSASPECLPVWADHDVLAEMLSTCNNPQTLLAALEFSSDLEVVHTVLANPATPRTPEVVALTRTHAEAVTEWLSHRFAQHYLGPRRGEFDRHMHADVLEILERDGGTQVLADLSREGLVVDMGDLRHRDDTFFSPAVAERVNRILTRHVGERSCVSRAKGADGDLVISAQPGIVELCDLVGKHPSKLTDEERARVQELIKEASTDELPRAARKAVLVAAAPTLSLETLRSLTWPDIGMADLPMEPTAEYPTAWSRDWAAQGLHPVPELRMVETSWQLAADAGAAVWDELGDNREAWIMVLRLIEDGWDGSLQDLIETAEASA